MIKLASKDILEKVPVVCNTLGILQSTYNFLEVSTRYCNIKITCYYIKIPKYYSLVILVGSGEDILRTVGKNNLMSYQPTAVQKLTQMQDVCSDLSWISIFLRLMPFTNYSDEQEQPQQLLSGKANGYFFLT